MVPLLLLALLAPSAAAAPLRFAPNLDDDDANGTVDWTDEWPDPVENDWLDLELPREAGRLSLAGDGATVRVWHAGQIVLGGNLAGSWEAPAGATVQVELGSWFASADLLFQPAFGAASHWQVEAAPIVLPHPLRPVERTWVMPLLGDEDEESNLDLLAALGEHAPRPWESVRSDLYDGDRWVQDQFEVAWAAGVHGPMRVIIDSPRDGLAGQGGAFVLDELAREPDTSVLFFPEGGDTAIDGFGNLEVTPPLGPDHPLGRVLTGRSGRHRLQRSLIDALRRFGAQEPLELDTSWLWVGHVDELISFLPDPAAPRGFRALLPSAALGLRALAELDPLTELPHYGESVLSDQDYPSAAAMQQDRELLAYNRRLERERLRPLRRQLTAELGLQDTEIALVPILFTEATEAGSFIRRASAITPNLLNLVSFPDERGAVVLVPDPMLRPRGAEPATDPFVRALLRALPRGVRVRLVDTWGAYHVHDGGVHCATNVQRAAGPDAFRAPKP